MITIAIAEDHKTMRAGLVGLLNRIPEFQVVINVSNGTELLNSISFQNLPDVFLIDSRMPEQNGAATILKIRELYGEKPKIIGLSMHKEARIIKEILQSGANGYVAKSDSPDSLYNAILEVSNSRLYVSSEILKLLKIKDRAHRDEKLNRKEESILLLICQEKTNQEIADQMKLSRNTINTYRTRMIEKLNVKNSIGLVLFAIREGIFKPG
ncbi:MAG: hypothetical protein COA58_04480 [Bacteroidetes bacterium]|nr:MAG: hypothetical protein COA58_04480 [Bacteroidota bacterium]